MNRAKIISIAVEQAGPGLFHATSPQIEGLFISGKTLEELREIVPLAIEAMFLAEGEPVRVIEADNKGVDIPMPWVILPAKAEQIAC